MKNFKLNKLQERFTAPTSGLLETAAGGVPLVQISGLNTAKAVNLAGVQIDTSGNMTGVGTLATGAQTITGTQTVSGAMTASSTVAVTGVLTPTGGVAGAGGFLVPTAFSSGGLPVNATTALSHKQIVTTETYFVEVFIPVNTTITGISILNSNTTSASQNMFVGLANSGGTIVANSNTTTAQGATNAYQQIAFTTPYPAVGPAKYFIAVQGSATTGFIETHTLGNFGASKITSETYGTFLTTATYKTTTFTTAVGPVASTY